MLPLLLALAPPAQALDAGPHPVGFRDVRFDHPAQGTVWARVHYPAERAGEDVAPERDDGPYPVVAFLHGWLGSAWMYDEVCDAVAAHGFVVVNMDTETHPFLDYEVFARDTVAALQWVEARADEPSHWLGGLTDGGPWSAMGHSMGGGTLARLSELAPRIETLVGFMPYESEEPGHYEALAHFPGAAMVLAGTDDETSTTDIVTGWFDRMERTRRGLFLDIEGAGHQAVSTFEWGEDTMPDRRQRAVVIDLATSFLAAEVLGDPAGHRDLMLDLPAPMRRVASRSVEPVVWVEADAPGQVTLSVLGLPEGEATLYAGRGPGRTDTDEHGPLDLAEALPVDRFTLVDGVVDARVPVDDETRGWFQVVVETEVGRTLGDPVEVFEGREPPGTPREPSPATPDAAGNADAPPTPETVLATCGGCASPGRATPGLGLLLLASTLLRRRT